MKQLNRHQLLLAIAGLGILLFLVSHMLVTRPLGRDVKQLRDAVNTKSTELMARGWPLDVDRLEEMASKKKQERDVTERLKDQVVAKTAGGFMDKIAPLYENRENFQRQATRLDYQEEYQRVIRKLEANGMRVSKEILNRSETSMAPKTYQLILHLWTLESIVDQLRTHNLSPKIIEHTPLDNTGKPQASVTGAAISMIDPRAFVLTTDAPEPYLLEFPVRLRIEGTIEDLHAFLQAAPNAERFIAVTGLEIQKPVPARNRSNKRLEVNLECSCFYLMAGKNAIPLLKPKPKILPLGA